MLSYRPNGRRRLWKHLKRLADEAETSYEGLTRKNDDYDHDDDNYENNCYGKCFNLRDKK